MKTADLIKEIITEQSYIVGDKIANERAEATKVIHLQKNKVDIIQK